MTIDEAKALARQELSQKRYTHVANVAAAAKSLAERWGEDPERAELAGWLHDIVKERPRPELLQLMGQDAIMAGSTARRPEPVWHGPCAAIYARHTLGVNDDGLLHAVDCHTTGRPGMTKLDKILMVADRTSAERRFPDVEEVRRAAMEDLDRAVAMVLRHSIQHVNGSGRELDPVAGEALESLLEERPDLRYAGVGGRN